MSDSTLSRAIAYGGLGFGIAALAAPRAFLKAYCVDDAPGTRLFARLWGVGNVAFSSLYLGTRDAAVKTRFQQVTLLMNTVDTVLIATAEGLGARSRIGGAVSAGAFAALSAVEVLGD